MSAAAAPRIDSASLVAFPAERPTRDLHSREVASARALCDEALQGEPLLSHVWENANGRVGVIMIPIIDMTLFDDPGKTAAAAVAGVGLAARLGARCVSFTGMIPAATDYGHAIAAGVGRDIGNAGGPGPALTTGHAAVVAAFAFNLEALLAAAGRSYADESIAFVGVGSIGEGILRLLNDHARPREIYVVDIHEQRARLERVKKEINAGFEIVTIDRRAGLPTWVYERCSLFLSATSTPVVIDVTRMRPGSLMVDDSFPFGFDAERAVSRLTGAADIRITIAGGLQGVAPFSLAHRIAGSRGPEFDLLLDRMEQIINPWPRCMTGCVYSSLLTNYHGLPPTLGPVTHEDAKRFYETLKAEGFRGTPPHIFTFNPAHAEPIHAMPANPLAHPRAA